MQISILLNSKSQYEVLPCFEKGLIKSFQNKGVKVVEYLIDENLPGRLADSTSDYTLGINVMLPDHMAIVPHIAYMVDWATHTPELFKGRHSIVCNVDRGSSLILEEFGQCKSLFLPHAISKDSIIDPPASKNIDILFAGTFVDEGAIAAKLKDFSPSLRKALDHLINQSLESTKLNHVQLLLKLFKDFPAYGNEMEGRQFTFFEICNIVEGILRARDRLNLLKAIDREFHLYGNNSRNWKKALKSQNNCIVHEAVSFSEMTTLLQSAKIVLNSSPMFKEGLHERILFALANGASVITNENCMLPDAFPHPLSVGTYIAPHYNRINPLIEKMLSNEEERKGAVLESQEIIKKQHTWDQRAAELLFKLV